MANAPKAPSAKKAITLSIIAAAPWEGIETAAITSAQKMGDNYFVLFDVNPNNAYSVGDLSQLTADEITRLPGSTVSVSASPDEAEQLILTITELAPAAQAAKTAATATSSSKRRGNGCAPGTMIPNI
jgi:hypothetical protein